jgi:phosphatidate cytidylyltransferase
VTLVIHPFTHYVSDFLWPKLDLIDIIVLSQVNALLSVYSDLLESFFKRCAGVKDSSSVLPGHGGFFDRLDSLLLPLPALIWYMYIFHYKDLNN